MYKPDTERYGGYDKEEELKNAELPPDRTPRNNPDTERYGGYDKEEELKNAELPPDRTPRNNP